MIVNLKLIIVYILLKVINKFVIFAFTTKYYGIQDKNPTGRKGKYEIFLC